MHSITLLFLVRRITERQSYSSFGDPDSSNKEQTTASCIHSVSGCNITEGSEVGIVTIVAISSKILFYLSNNRPKSKMNQFKIIYGQRAAVSLTLESLKIKRLTFHNYFCLENDSNNEYIFQVINHSSVNWLTNSFTSSGHSG